MAKAEGVRLYATGRDEWVAVDGDGVIAWPAEDRGWARRRTLAKLPPDARECEIHNAVGTGWPRLEWSEPS